jgi:hypothetical protein
MSETVVAPRAITARIALSGTPRQRQTIIAHSATMRALAVSA